VNISFRQNDETEVEMVGNVKGKKLRKEQVNLSLI